MNTKTFSNILYTVFIALIIAGCGGGGGGGDTPAAGGGGGGGGGGGNIAAITSSNAMWYAANVGYLADIMDLADGGSAVITGVAVENQKSRASLSQFIDWQLDMLPGMQGQIFPSNIVGVLLEPQIIDCPSGNMTVVWDDMDHSGTLTSSDTAQVTFNDCEGAIWGTDTINGVLAISALTVTGDWNVLGPWSLLATFTFNNLQITWSTGDVTLPIGSEMINGILNIDQSTSDGVAYISTYTGSLNGSVTDIGESYTYSYTNMDLNGSFDDSSGAYSGNFDGDITDSDLGTFKVDTLQSFEGVDSNDPYTGIAKVIGVNSSVTMTVLDNINVRLDIDTDGDDITDDTINTIWAVLNNT